MRIAMVGVRGVPATFGGTEHHVEQLGSRLAARGHEVAVYCRPNYVQGPLDSYRGMRLRHLPTVGTKHLDAIVHSGLSTIDAVRGGYDVVHYHALGPGLVAPLPRYASRAKVVLTVHGMDNERAKWGRVAKTALNTAAWMSAHVPDATITVSKALTAHYAQAYGRQAHFIPNGVNAGPRRSAEAVRRRFDLGADPYVLYVGRLVPEKAPDLLIRAFRQVPGDVRLVVAGGSAFTDDYVEKVGREAASDPRVVLPGYVYGDVLSDLYANAAVFVLPSFLEGLPLTLLEAAAHGAAVVASDIPPHREVLLDDGPGHRLFPPGDEAELAAVLRRTVADPAPERQGAVALCERVMREYRWDAVTEATEDLYGRLLTGRP